MTPQAKYKNKILKVYKRKDKTLYVNYNGVRTTISSKKLIKEKKDKKKVKKRKRNKSPVRKSIDRRKR